MIVGFDGTVLRGPKTGIGYYTYFLVQHLLRHHREFEILIFDGLRMRHPVLEGGEGKQQASKANLLAVAGRLSRVETARKAWRALKATGFRRAGRGLDLFHATNYLPPAPIDLPVLPLIHDVSHLRHPEWHPPERVKWLESRTEEFSQAPLVQTVSRFSANEIVATLGIDPERVHVTYPGINPLYRDAVSSCEERLRSYAVEPGRFFLCVGALEPRKNLTTVITAYARLSQSLQRRFPLLVAGPPGWGDLALPPDTARLELSGAIRFLGYVDERSMSALYGACTAFLFPSSYEGFGMPVSEAMATGARPIIASGGAPEEVAGPLGFACPAFDIAAWSQAMEMAVEEKWHSDEALRAKLRETSERFDWLANAEASARLYEICKKQEGVAASDD